MNKNCLILTLSLFAVSMYAQNSTQDEQDEWKSSRNEYKNFDIGKYFTPNIVRNQLNTDFSFRSDYSLIDPMYGDGKREAFDLTGNLSASFSRYVNTRKKISSLTVDLALGLDDNSLEKRQSFTGDYLTFIDNQSTINQQNSLRVSWSNRWYFSKLFFMHYGLSSGIFYTFSHNKIKNQTEDSNVKHHNFIIDASPNLGVGYGRIEDVRDARHALYIANALSKKKVLTRNLSNDELFELSQIISTVKNKRFLDSRLHLIEEITTLNTFFEDNDLLEDNGAAYFTTLYDMWQFGDLFSRKSGFEVSFTAQPHYSHRNVKYTPTIQDVVYNQSQYIANLNFRYEKPFKINWQHSLAATVSGGIGSSSTKNKQADSQISTKYNSLVASASYSLGYYPNTRTNIRVTTLQQISKNLFGDDERSIYFYSSIGAILYYYFSPNLRLSGDYGLVYSPNRAKEYGGDYIRRNNFSSTFNLQLTYSIF